MKFIGTHQTILLRNIKFSNLVILAPVTISAFFFTSSLRYFFFQDDFYEIVLSRVTNLKEFLRLFAFLENRSSYRPIGLQLFFYVSRMLFGLNPTFYRTIVFAMFFSSYFLIIKVISKISANYKIGLLTAFFWVTASIHFMSTSWLAASWLITGTFFFFLTSLLFLKYLETKKRIYYIFSIIFFLITAGAFEFFLVWPVIFGIYISLFLNKSLKFILKILAPFIVISLIYVLLRIFLASLPQIEEYKISLGVNTLKQYFWYFLWTFNVPEEFKKQISTNLIIFNNTFLAEYYLLILKSFLAMALIVVIGVVYPLYKAYKNGPILNYKLVTLSLSLFTLGILPVVIFPNHSFAMYLVLASLGIYLLISYLTVTYTNTLFITIISLIWIYSSYTTVSFYKNNSWIIESQRFAREFKEKILEKFPYLPNNAVVYYPLSDQRHIQALLDQNAIKVIYNNPSISIYYNAEKLNQDLLDGIIPASNLYKY